MKKRNILSILSIAAVGGFFMLQSCSKDPVDPPATTTPAEVKPYILVNGKKFIGAQPKLLAVKYEGGDSVLRWVGTGFLDTSVAIIHAVNNIKSGTYSIDSTGAPDPNFVAIVIRWGNNISSLSLNIAKGNYELKRENGKYVSYLKNGEAFNGSDHADRYYNIEFKVIWPY